MFWRGGDCQPNAWIFIGVGIRKAQDVGAHRKKVYRNKPSVEEDLWKRVFWLLVSFDRINSAELGRSCNIRDEECVIFH
jgi:Fungal specific transcription factor domain